MTGKELVVPLTIAISVGGSAVLIANSYGRNAQALLQVQTTLGQIQADLKERDRAAQEVRDQVIEYKVRIGKLESFVDGQAALNARVLGHLDARGD